MKIDKIKDMKDGWFVGDFEPTAYKTNQFEVSYKFHYKGEKYETHYHTLVTEINCLIEGSMVIQGQHLENGDIFTLYPYEIADPVFLTDCKIICVKTPSSNDKISFEIKNETNSTQG
jgi:hypothetical protein